MKQKISLFIALLAIAQLPVFGQFMAKSYKSGLPIVTEEAIKNIVVTDDIDVLLIEDRPEKSGVSISSTAVEKLRVRVDGESLYLGTDNRLAPGERLHVFVTVNDLNRLELKGNAYATSKGILNSRNLFVVVKGNARVALRSKGEVMMSSPYGYRITKEREYYTVNSANTL